MGNYPRPGQSHRSAYVVVEPGPDGTYIVDQDQMSENPKLSAREDRNPLDERFSEQESSIRDDGHYGYRYANAGSPPLSTSAFQRVGELPGGIGQRVGEVPGGMGP